MKPVLPDILDRYFAAQNAHDIEAMVACFAPDAIVRDEGKDIVGTQAIRAWKIETGAKYRIRLSRSKAVSKPAGQSSSLRSPARFRAAQRT
jgi:hypothetical protein